MNYKYRLAITLNVNIWSSILCFVSRMMCVIKTEIYQHRRLLFLSSSLCMMHWMIRPTCRQCLCQRFWWPTRIGLYSLFCRQYCYLRQLQIRNFYCGKLRFRLRFNALPIGPILAYLISVYENRRVKNEPFNVNKPNTLTRAWPLNFVQGLRLKALH